MAACEILRQLVGIDLRALSPLQRILLVTDGTLTEILEAYFLEPITLVKLAQQMAPAIRAQAALGLAAGEPCLERKIFLQGAETGRIYVYAESLIAIERLGAKLREDLMATGAPLGRLWLEHRLETFKELIDMRCRPAGDLAQHFGVKPDAPLLARSYRVSAGGRPVILISEFFGAA
jgi:chorismate-pyruvate lyase